MKTCNTCGVSKPLSDFHKRSDSLDGHSHKCKGCKAKHDAEYRLSNKEKIRTKQKEWERTNREHVNLKSKIWSSKNKDKARKAIKRWAENNREKRNASEAKRRAIKLTAIPLWANEEKIRSIYLTCPDGYHVDHILPLQGETVCGLHVENNLQHLPSNLNLSKSNKLLEVYCGKSRSS